MRSKKLLAALLLGVGLCFVPALGHGEIIHRADQITASYMDLILLRALVHYIIHNPTNFLNVSITYDPAGVYGEDMGFPHDVDTKGEITIMVHDNRDVFSYKLGIALLDEFKRKLETIYSFIGLVAKDMNGDIVAAFYSGEDIPLGYFYQGEYHLWGK